MDLTMLLFLPIQPPGPRPRGPEDEPVGEDDDEPARTREPPREPPPSEPLPPDANPIDPRIWREED